jgi:tetratricopeptide (TPR) repeat protein
MTAPEVLKAAGDDRAAPPRVAPWSEELRERAATTAGRAEDVRAVISLLRGTAMVDAEEHAAGEAQLMSFVERFRGREDLLPNMASAWIDAHNRLGILWSNRSEPVKGLNFLREAERMYRVTRDRYGKLAASENASLSEEDGASGGDPAAASADAADDADDDARGAAADAAVSEAAVIAAGPVAAASAHDEDGDGTFRTEEAGGAEGAETVVDGASAKDSASSAASSSAAPSSAAASGTSVTPCVVAALHVVDDLESLYTHTAFYLAQCYGSLEPPQRDKASFYCLLTLRRQMADVTGRPGVAFSPVEWAANCLGLSHYFTVEGQFERADQCLQAARKILPDNADRELRAKLVATCGRHIRNLLDLSRHRAVGISMGSITDGGDNDVLAARSPNSASQPADINDEVLFPTMSLKPPRKPARNSDEARELFNVGMDYYNAALRTYVFDGFVTDHVTIVQDISAMYRSLAALEPERTRRLAMHKRRAALLEPMLTMNPNAYHAIYKGVTYETAEVYSEIADLLREKYIAEAADPAKAAHYPAEFIAPKYVCLGGFCFFFWFWFWFGDSVWVLISHPIVSLTHTHSQNHSLTHSPHIYIYTSLCAERCPRSTSTLSSRSVCGTRSSSPLSTRASSRRSSTRRRSTRFCTPTFTLPGCTSGSLRAHRRCSSQTSRAVSSVTSMWPGTSRTGTCPTCTTRSTSASR